MKTTPEKRRGPRQDGVQAREAILDAAREQFAANGFEGATMRAIAREAGVDPALVSYYFGSKSDLFLESLRLPVNPAAAIDERARGRHGRSRDAPRHALPPGLGQPRSAASRSSAVLRSASSQPELMRDFLERQIVPAFARAVDAPDAELRASAVASQMLGLAFTRYVLRVEPIASAPARGDRRALRPDAAALHRRLAGRERELGEHAALRRRRAPELVLRLPAGGAVGGVQVRRQGIPGAHVPDPAASLVTPDEQLRQPTAEEMALVRRQDDERERLGSLR